MCGDRQRRERGSSRDVGAVEGEAVASRDAAAVQFLFDLARDVEAVLVWVDQIKF